MTLRVPNVGEVEMVEAILALNLKLRLFENNKVPADADVTADYTPASFIGYAEANIVSASWTITAGDPCLAVQPALVFTSTAGGQNKFVYGYYVVKATGELMWAERFDDNDPTAPYHIVNNGDTITVPLRFTLKDTID